MTNESASRGRQIEYTELSQLQPAKSVSVFGYVHEFVCKVNTDNLGQPQREYRLALMDSKTLRPVTFSLFLNNDDDAFRGELRAGMLVRVHGARCRKTDGGMWLFGKAGVAGMHVVGFDLRDVLDLVCTTSASFSFTQLHHDKLSELQRHFMRRVTEADSTIAVLAFHGRPIGRLVQDHTYAPSVAYSIGLFDKLLTPGHSPPPVVITLEDDEPLTPGHSPPPVVITLEDDEPLTPGHSSPPVVITLEDDEPESNENAEAVALEPTRPTLSAVGSQVSESVAARRSNTPFTEVVTDTRIPPLAASSHTQPAAPKRPRMEQPLTPPFHNLQTMRSAIQPSWFDCTCEVIKVWRKAEYVILRVWDGTKPSRRLTRNRRANPIRVDSEPEASVNDYAVNIICYGEHARSAEELKAHDKVSVVNVHAFVNRSGVETYVMHAGDADYGRAIRRLEDPDHVKELERRLSAVRRPSTQSQGGRDGEAASTYGRQPGIFRA